MEQNCDWPTLGKKCGSKECKQPFLGEGNDNVTRKKWLHERLSAG